jgi:protocatechuate 3,4-dioxygenase beta subunit
MGASLKFRPESPGDQPELRDGGYGSTATRAPRMAPVHVEQGPTELSGPQFSSSLLYANCGDLTRQSASGGAPLGERIIVRGKVTDESGAPVKHALIEIWQANAAGRYRHPVDVHDAPLDPHFSGAGRVMTDAQGDYEFVTIKPGSYPWRNHVNAWRPAHIHFSIFGSSILQRLVTQMYFPGDPLLELDPIIKSVPDEAARKRLVARFDLAVTRPEWALGYRFDIVLRGPEATPQQA